MALLTNLVLSMSITWPIILRPHWSNRLQLIFTVTVGHKYVNVHRHQLLILSEINNVWSMTVTVLQRKASTQEIGLLLVPAIKRAVYINTHCNYSQPVLTKLYNENIGGHPYTFTPSTDFWNIQVSGCIMQCAVSRSNMGCILFGPGDLSGLSRESVFSTRCSATVITNWFESALLSSSSMSYSWTNVLAKYSHKIEAVSWSVLVLVPSCLLMLGIVLLTVCMFLM